MQLRQDNTQRQTQTQRIAPHLIQANTLLQCSTLELMQMIAQEQRENPALDGDEDGFDQPAACRSCPYGAFPCVRCPYRRDGLSLDSYPLREAAEHEPSSGEHHDTLAGSGEDTSQDEQRAARQESDLTRIETDAGSGVMDVGDGEFDPLLLARAQITLAEHLLSYLRATSSSPQEERIAEYLVDSLDEHGFLQIDLEEACLLLRVPCSQITDGIARLQGCDPPGIGARDLRECLLLQMRHRREQQGEEEYDPITARLIEDYWDALVQRRHSYLARRVGVTPERLAAALKFLHALTPYPAAQFRSPWDHRPDTQSMAIRPDVIFKRTPTGFEIEVLGFENMSLHINPHYRSLYEEIRVARADKSVRPKARLSPDHEKHVLAYVERANLFLKNLQQRRRTIQKIAQALIQCQQGFIETGQRAFLKPLTRTRLAQIVGMHESTISRALLHKFVQLPSQDVVSFDVFFENATTAKDALAALIADEDPDAPLSDQALTDALSARGLDIARRTVVKYREEMRIPASYLRRRR